MQTPSAGGNVSRDESNVSVDGGDGGDQRTDTPTVVAQPAASGDDETETDETPEQPRKMNFVSTFAPTQGDFFFGEGELALLDFEPRGDRAIHQQDWTLPSEAFALRHEIQDHSPPPEQFPNHSPTDHVSDNG